MVIKRSGVIFHIEGFHGFYYRKTKKTTIFLVPFDMKKF